jgi:hypothetical protein
VAVEMVLDSKLRRGATICEAAKAQNEGHTRTCETRRELITPPMSRGRRPPTPKMSLSPQERDRIHQECKFAIKKMYSCMEMAEREARKITNVDIREATIGAIEGAVCGLGGRSPYTVIIGGCLGALARISGDSYRHFVQSKDFVRDAQAYARIADDLQERLWRDK